ncbi:MAG: transcriptional regulator [Elusimicrobia bacterium]|nr:MAG: transcriptional regulator [Elusimicrobiota bacterium]
MAKTKLGRELISGLKEAITFEKGRKKLRVSTIEIPEPARKWKKKEIVKLRKECLNVSQPIFASCLSVTVSAVRAWEQGQKSPGGPARRLLEIVELDPEVFRKLAHAQMS